MSLLPSRDPVAGEGEPRVLAVDDEAADDVFAALSSDTARALLAALHESPAPPAELAERVDTSLQNAQYHLEKLSTAGAVEVVDTAYSEKGREMDVYAPANEPLVICAGDDAETDGVRSALRQLLGGVGVLAAASLVVEGLLGPGGLLAGDRVRSGSTDGRAPDTSFLPGSGPTPTGNGGGGQLLTDGGPAAVEATAALSPGAAFFAGGAVVLLGLFAIWYVRG